MNIARRALLGSTLAVAAVTGGTIGAGFLSTAGAATTPAAAVTTPAATIAAPTTGGGHTPDWSVGGHQANGKTETVLTGDALAKAEAAAKAAVPGATAERAETDAEGATYEVHMAKADGSIVTVKLDASFAVTSTIDGMG